MAHLQWSSSPSPRHQSAELNKHVNGHVASLPPKSVQYLRHGVFSGKAGCNAGSSASRRLLNTGSDCKDAHFDVKTIVVCNHLSGEPLHCNTGYVMEPLALGNFQGFRNLIVNPNVLAIVFNANHNVFNPSPSVPNPKGLNTNPNEFSSNLNASNANPYLSFTGGDDSGKGSGSGGGGGGHNGHDFGEGDHLHRHNSGLALLGMQALFQGMNEANILDQTATFDSLNFLLRRLDIDVLDHNSRGEGDRNDNSHGSDYKDDPSHGTEGSREMHMYGVNKDHGMHLHGQNLNDVITHIVGMPSSLPSSLLNQGFNDKASEKTRDALNICDTSSSQTNSSNSDAVAETNQRNRPVDTFFGNLRRHISHIQWKFAKKNQEHAASVPVQIDFIDGEMLYSDQGGEILIKSCTLEGDTVLLAESHVSSPMQAQSEKQNIPGKSVHHTISTTPVMAPHLWQRGVIDWFGQLALPALPKEVDSTSKAEHVEQHESRVSSSEGATVAPKVDSENGGMPPGVKQLDIDALRRLQREVFSELMKLREKVVKLEQLAQARQKMDQFVAARTHLKGQVKAGTAFVLLEGSSSRHARDSLEQAGMQTGLDVKFTFETPFREKDVLITECVSGQGGSVGDGRALGGPLSLGKLQYVAHVNDDVSFSFVPLGAQGKDVTEIINVLQDEGLTAFSSQGPALFNHCKGSALGATVSGSRFAFSLAQYLSGWGNHVSLTGSLFEEDPLCLSTLGQFLLQPTEGFILALSGLNQYWPSPPLPSTMSLHWSEMGPLIIPKIQWKAKRYGATHLDTSGESLLHIHRLGSHWETPDIEYGTSACKSKGTGLLSLAVASSLDLGENLSVSGWVQIEKGESLQDFDKGNFQWGVSLARASGSGIDWGASIGVSRPDMWSMSNSSRSDYSGYERNDLNGSQLHMEAFFKLSCGRGFTLQPGVLYVSSKHSHTPAFVVRSSWSL